MFWCEGETKLVLQTWSRGPGWGGEVEVLEEGRDGQVDLRLGEGLPRAAPHPGAVGDDLPPPLVAAQSVQ